MIGRRGIVLLASEAGDHWLDWLRGSGLNVVGIHPEPTQGAAEAVEAAIRLAASAAGRAFRDRLVASGCAVEYELHAMSWLLPRLLFGRHPDWFRMSSKGERTPDFNLCPSNREALAFAAERAALLAARLTPTTGRCYLWTDDMEDAGCRCGDCRRLSPADQTLRIYNALLRGVRRHDPGATLAYLAYYEALAAPAAVEPEAGIFLEFAPVRRSWEAPLDDPGCADNALHVARLERLLEVFGASGAQALEYWVDASRFAQWKRPAGRLPFRPEVVRRDAAFYHARGIGSVTSFAGYYDEAYVERFGPPPIREYGRILAAVGSP